jgi:hypothetical protein
MTQSAYRLAGETMCSLSNNQALQVLADEAGAKHQRIGSILPYRPDVIERHNVFKRSVWL